MRWFTARSSQGRADARARRRGGGHRAHTVRAAMGGQKGRLPAHSLAINAFFLASAGSKPNINVTSLPTNVSSVTDRLFESYCRVFFDESYTQ